MKVLLINGSPHEKGCTYTALSLIAGELKAQGIETEILHVGGQPVRLPTLRYLHPQFSSQSPRLSDYILSPMSRYGQYFLPIHLLLHQ